jgi:hypothetical protein
MARLSLRLPETLHQQLTLQARREGVSLNQYLLFLLAQRSAPAWVLVPSEESAEEQETAFAKLRQELGASSVSSDEIRKVLDERDPVDPEPGWTPELKSRFEQLLAVSRSKARADL